MVYEEHSSANFAEEVLTVAQQNYKSVPKIALSFSNECADALLKIASQKDQGAASELVDSFYDITSELNTS